jgi:cytochrome oxidase Cu insertion factor (SCO1/SenC/PrrC family)
VSQVVLSEEERRAAFEGTAPKVPRKAAVAMVVACLVLGFGGLLVDHFLGTGSRGLTTAIPAEKPPPLANTKTGAGEVGAPAATAALMNLVPKKSALAPGFRLFSASGRSVSLSGLVGKVVVVGFLDSRCDDICPLLSRELVLARQQLRAAHVSGAVSFLVVNTDPVATRRADASAAVRMLAPSNTTFVTGSLAALDSVWKSYGITIDVQQHSAIVTHDNLLAFIDKKGDWVASATPFGNEVKSGVYALAPSTLKTFARGIAEEASSLVRQKGHN